jgi:hypothetical protein
MSVRFGRGITLKNGIKITGYNIIPPQPNTFTVANQVGKFGASSAAPTFGVLTSDYLWSIYHDTTANPSPIGKTIIFPKDGTYSGFSISSGAIDGDLTTYPRVFTITGDYGAENYELIYDGNFYYVALDDDAGLESRLGDTLGIVYNPAIQPTLTANTIKIMQFSLSGELFSGATTNAASTSVGVFGTVVSDYLRSVFYRSTNTGTYIELVDGTYAGFSVSGGAIDGDTSGSTRKFTINSIVETLTFDGAMYSYQAAEPNGDPFGIADISMYGDTVPAVYDPAIQGGGGGGGGLLGNTYNIVSMDWSPGGFGLAFIFNTSGDAAAFAAEMDGAGGGWFTLNGVESSAFGSPYPYVTGTVTTTGPVNYTSGDTLALWFNPYWTVNVLSGSSSPGNNTVTIGGGTTYALEASQTSAWGSAPWRTNIILFVPTSDTAAVTAMDSLASNATIGIKQGTNIIAVTISGTLTKDPQATFNAYFGSTANTNLSYATSWQDIDSVIL